MKKTLTLQITVLIFILVMCGCTYTGRNDISLFTTNFNSVADNNLQIESEDMIIHFDEENGENTYYLFFPAKSDGEYMITLNENADGDIYKCGICIISSIDVEIKIIEDLFVSELFALKNVAKRDARALFEELNLDEKDTYTKTSNSKTETDFCCVDLIVGNAGTGIYIY